MAEFKGITFNGIKNPSFMRVSSIGHSLTSPITNNYIDIPGGNGGYYTGISRFGVRIIPIDVKIISEDKNLLPRQLELLARWLVTDEPKELILGDNINRRYYAKLDGEAQFSETLRLGEGTITFICFDPFIYGPDMTIENSGNKINYSNAGSATSPYILDIDIKQDSTYLGANINDKFIEFGIMNEISINPGVYDPSVLYETCGSLSGWTKATSVYGGSVSDQGCEVSQNMFIRPTTGKIEEKDSLGWYGPSMYKTFKSEVQNFRASFTMSLDRTEEEPDNELGRTMVLIKDNNNRDMFCVMLHDSWDGSNTIRAEAFLIDADRGNYYLIQGFDVTLGNKEKFVTANVTRSGDVWSCDLFINLNGQSIPLTSGSVSDPSGLFRNRKGKYAQFAFQRYEKNPAMYSSVYHLEVVNTDTPQIESQKPKIIVRNGDRITINTRTGETQKNGVAWAEELNLMSDFSELRQGKGIITSYPAQCIKSMKLRFVEKYY